MQNNKLINIIHPSKSHAKLTSPLSQPETRNRETKLREKKALLFFPPTNGGKSQEQNKGKQNKATENVRRPTFLQEEANRR